MASVAPLQTINQKERALRQRIEAVQRETETRIRAAHKEAEERVAQAERAGRKAAEAFYQQEITQTQQEAEALITAAEQKTGRMRQEAVDRLEVTARQIVELVLPVGVTEPALVQWREHL